MKQLKKLGVGRLNPSHFPPLKHVGAACTFPPFEFVEDGKIVGYGKDILDYIIADLGVELNQLDLPWQGILPGVLAGKFDFVATSVSIRAE